VKAEETKAEVVDKKPEGTTTQEKPKTTRKRTTKKPETKTEDTKK